MARPSVPTTFYAAIKAAPADCSTFTGTQKLVCQLTKAHLGIAAAIGATPASVVLSWSFSTQSIDDTLNVIALTTAPKQTRSSRRSTRTRPHPDDEGCVERVAAGQGEHLPRFDAAAVLPDGPDDDAAAASAAVLSSFWQAANAPPDPLTTGQAAIT